MKPLIAILLALAACRSPSHHSTRDDDRAAAEAPRPDHTLGGNVVPRSHQIPPGHAEDVRRLFASKVISYPVSVVSSAGTNTQFVEPDPSFIGSDRFVVGVPPEFHDELDRVLAEMAKEPPSPPPVTYTMTYWAISAVPSSDVQIAPDLAELEPVLKSLGALGPRKFQTIDRISTRALDGVRAELKSRELVVEQTLGTEADQLQLKLELQLRNVHGGPTEGEIGTKLALAPDKPIVLGETADAGSGDPAGLVLYVVRARRAE